LKLASLTINPSNFLWKNTILAVGVVRAATQNGKEEYFVLKPI